MSPPDTRERRPVGEPDDAPKITGEEIDKNIVPLLSSGLDDDARHDRLLRWSAEIQHAVRLARARTVSS